MIPLDKKFNIFFKIIIFLLLFYFVFELSYFKHWTSHWDQELVLIHNSLLLNSGLKAEWHDHPGHTQILVMSLWLDLLKFLNVIKVASYSDFKNIFWVKNDFFDLVKYSRFINLFSSLILTYSIYNILKIISKKQTLSYLITLVFITSYPLIRSLSETRTELLSISFIFLSFLFLLKLLKSNILKRKNIFWMGFFFTLSIFCKYQSIFVFIFFPILTYFVEKKKIEININKYENSNLYKLISIFLIFIISLVSLKYAKGLNLFFIPFIYFYFYLMIIFLNKKFFRHIKFNFIFIYFFLIGVFFALVVLVVPKPFHNNNINMILNFLGAASMFVQYTNPYELNFNNILSLLNTAFLQYYSYLRVIFLKYSFNELLLILVSSTIVFFYYIDKKIIKNHFKILLIILSIIFIFSVRPTLNYLLYFTPIIYFHLVFVLRKINNNLIVNSCLVALVLINLSTYNEIRKVTKYQTAELVLCSVDSLKTKHFFLEKMRLEIFPRACKND